jgi:ribosomal protein S21
MRNNKRYKQPSLSGVLTVEAHECGGDAEKMVRKFIRKSKKEGIVEEFRNRCYYTKPTQIRAEQKRNKKRLIQKINRKRDELFKTTERIVPKRRKR